MEDLKERPSLETALDAAAATGMTTAVWAELQPNKVAVVNPDGSSRTFAQVNAAANKLTRLFRQHGLKAGDALAILDAFPTLPTGLLPSLAAVAAGPLRAAAA